MNVNGSLAGPSESESMLHIAPCQDDLDSWQDRCLWQLGPRVHHCGGRKGRVRYRLVTLSAPPPSASASFIIGCRNSAR